MRAALRQVRNEDGIALLLVLLVAMAVGAMAITAVLVSGNARLITQYEERQDELEAVSDAGLEWGRSRINGNLSLYPDSGYATLENGVAVTDAGGNPIPGVKRYTYAGPTGVSTGQFGVFGTVVSVAQAPNGDRVIRRGEIFQESFAKFAYFTDVEPSAIAFGSGDQIQGPVHSNDIIKIYNSGATFRGPGQVTTARSISGKQYGTFLEGSQEGVARIDLPRTAELEKLRGYAGAGGTSFTAPNGGNADDARIRIEFLTIDVDGDGVANGPDEGFFRVYTTTRGGAWSVANSPGAAGWPASENCGSMVGGVFVTPATAPVGWNANQRRALLSQPGARCYLGGDPMLTGGVFVAEEAPVSRGRWMARPFAMAGAPPAALTGRDDFNFLFPLSRRFNPDFKGVIHVRGRVAVSGMVRGRITLAATDDILIVDDFRYAIDPGAGNCTDIVGLFSGTDVVVADNAINTPQQVATGSSAPFVTLDDTPNEFIHSVVLALNTFTVGDFDGGPTAGQPCEGVSRGRGCLYLTGGVIQRERGGVGTTTGHGYLKRYSYDACAYRQPPPYYPTTGRFGKARYYEVDPNGFTAASFFARWTAG